MPAFAPHNNEEIEYDGLSPIVGLASFSSFDNTEDELGDSVEKCARLGDGGLGEKLSALTWATIELINAAETELD